MKWVKVAIGAVIAIISIGIIATSVYGMTQEKVREEVVTFEVVTETTVTSGTYNLILEYAIFDEFNRSINMTKYIIEGDAMVDTFIMYSSNEILIRNDNGDQDFIQENDIIRLADMWLDGGYVLEMTFEVPVPPQLTGTTATLILLTPLIFAGGVLAYLLNKQEI